MNKKPYEAPQLKQVRLEMKSAILAVCNQSPTVMDPKIGPTPCSIMLGCYDPNL
jgi:hypothetical protein